MPASDCHSSSPGPATAVQAPRTTGFTLVELIVTLAIASILVGIAAPSFSEMIANQRTQGVATDLYIALSRARSEALKRNVSVTLSPTAGGQWTGGWNIPDPADNSRKLHDHAAISGVAITGPTSITYRSSGRISADAGVAFDVSSSAGTMHWCVSVDLSGRPYSEKKTSC